VTKPLDADCQVSESGLRGVSKRGFRNYEDSNCSGAHFLTKKMLSWAVTACSPRFVRGSGKFMNEASSRISDESARKLRLAGESVSTLAVSKEEH